MVRSHTQKSETAFVLNQGLRNPLPSLWLGQKEICPSEQQTQNQREMVLWSMIWSIFLSSLASCTGCHLHRTSFFAVSGTISDSSHCLSTYRPKHAHILNWDISKDLVWSDVSWSSSGVHVPRPAEHGGKSIGWCLWEWDIQYHRPGDHSNGLKRIMLSLSSDSYVFRERASLGQMQQIRSIFLGKCWRRDDRFSSVDLKLCPVQCSFKSITFF